MTLVQVNARSATIVADTSVLINFLRIDRVDLFADHSHAFVVTSHVAAEVTDHYPGQKQLLAAAAINAVAIVEKQVDS